jgi:hypothetical protein
MNSVRSLRSASTSLAIAAALAAVMPPRNTGRIVVPPAAKTPERLTAAQMKRERKAAKRAGGVQ